MQQARRDAGLDVSDRITLTVASPDEEVRQAVDTHRELVAGETLARQLEVGGEVGGGPVDGAGAAVEVGEGWTVRVSVRREA